MDVFLPTILSTKSLNSNCQGHSTSDRENMAPWWTFSSKRLQNPQKSLPLRKVKMHSVQMSTYHTGDSSKHFKLTKTELSWGSVKTETCFVLFSIELQNPLCPHYA